MRLKNFADVLPATDFDKQEMSGFILPRKVKIWHEVHYFQPKHLSSLKLKI